MLLLACCFLLLLDALLHYIQKSDSLWGKGGGMILLSFYGRYKRVTGYLGVSLTHGMT